MAGTQIAFAQSYSLDQAQISHFHKNGFLVIPEVLDDRSCRLLRERAQSWTGKLQEEKTEAIFTTSDQSSQANAYFLGSGDKVRIFMEPDQIHVNKLGHALHVHDPHFKEVSLHQGIGNIAASLGLGMPTVVQSMFIFKDAGMGGPVKAHQDESFLINDPAGVIGFWFALEDATIQNGCLYALAGGHHSPLKEKFIRTGAGGCEMVQLSEVDWPADDFIPLEVKAGSLVLLHGLLPHFSRQNKSAQSRNAYAIHLVDGRGKWSSENWLQPGEQDSFCPILPFKTSK